VRFPFSDLTRVKLRPAIVLANSGRGDWVLCQITSKTYGDSMAVQIEDASFQSGSLRLTSYARPGKLFTANTDLIVGCVGQLTSKAHQEIVDSVVDLLRAGGSP
jgi:mRNA interferase MazF